MDFIKTIITGFLLLAFCVAGTAQPYSKFIIVDQFGYLPAAKKIAVIKDPQTGFDAGESFTPGSLYSMIEAGTGTRVYSGGITQWKGGDTCASSGDRIWHFDFSDVTETGTYYILDEENSLRSYEFVISHNVYNEILKQAMRTFFYQRAGYAKETEYAGEAWADGASHVDVDNCQDLNCRSFFDKQNPATEKDVSGGWYDAGDYNKYTNWTANYVVSMMKAYLEKPDAWADDYNIPESGNGIPDLLDEAIWGIDHLLRMQQLSGAVLSIVGESHGSPPSSATDTSTYGPPNTSATLNTAAAFAISSKVYRDIGMTEYADTLLARSLKAWDWAEIYPDSLFNNNDAAFNSEGLGAGRQEVDSYGRGMIKLEAACYLFEITGDTDYQDYFDAHYQECHLMQWYWAYPFESDNQDALLYYTLLENGTSSVQDNIRNVYRNTVLNNEHNLAAYTSGTDPYMAYIKDYTWGSNGVKSAQGGMYCNLSSYNIDNSPDATDAALGIINYIHGVNPLNFVYLSNMYAYGAENGVNEFYHSWFSNGSPLWDRVGVSVWGPAPGFLTGGPNPSYDWDDCCPTECGSAGNNAKCYSESISPPKGQPNQKSYKDFNTSWPINSWSVTENSCGYQVNYIRLLSKFITAEMDCNGDVSGTAFIDSCGVCAGGNTGITPVTDPDSCFSPIDCNGDQGGTAFVDSCGICAGGNTGITPVWDTNDCVGPVDCNGDEYGTAFIDSCGNCAGGNTGITPVTDPDSCIVPVDCNGDEYGTAFIDSCGNCAGGNTGITPVTDPESCVVPVDCNGDEYGTAFIDSCGICAGGNTGLEPILDTNLCNGSFDNSIDVNQQPVIYPNPARGTLQVIGIGQSPCLLRIIDLSGKVVVAEEFTGLRILDIMSLPPGFYEVSVIGAGKISRHKLIKL